MANDMVRGTVWLMFSQSSFILSGYAIHIILGRALGPVEYGLLGVILSLIGLVQIFFQNGIPQSVSKYVSEGLRFSSVIKSGLNAQAYILCIIMPAYLFAAFVMSLIIDDSRLLHYLLFAAVIFPLRSFVDTYNGAFNGLREFGKQAKTFMTYSIVKVVSVLFLVKIGFGIEGVIVALILANLSQLILSSIWLRPYLSKNHSAKQVSTNAMLSFTWPIIIFAFSYLGVMSLDIVFVKALVADEEQAGLYAAASVISRLPFYLFFALSYTLLPSVSKASSMKNKRQIRGYITHSMRYLLMVILPFVAIMSATSHDLITFTYSFVYRAAGDILGILSIGILFMTVFVTLSTVLIGAGKPRIPMLVSVIMLSFSMLLNYVMVISFGAIGAALAMAGSSFLGMLMICAYVYREYGVLTNPISVLKIVLGSATVYILADILSIGPWGVLIVYPFSAVIYLGVIAIIGEFGSDDRKMFENALGMFFKIKAKDLSEKP